VNKTFVLKYKLDMVEKCLIKRKILVFSNENVQNIRKYVK